MPRSDGAGTDHPLRIFWERHSRLLELMVRGRRIATHRELEEMMRLRQAAADFWSMHPQASAEWPEWVPSETALATRLSRVPDLPPVVPSWLRLEEGEPAEAPRATQKPRHRWPAQIATETVKQLKWELAQRKKRPTDPEHTQEKIAERVGLNRTRVQQAEQLQRVGWGLLRSHPEFSADDGFVRWPNPRDAVQLLASERAEN